jgi:transcription antitermination factor NusG
MSIYWYALHCKPNRETCVAGQLGFHQIEFFYPTFQVRPVNPRSRKVKPYFPGYLFLHADLSVTDTSILNWMPGTVGLVVFDHLPAVVPDNLIAAIHQHVIKLNRSGFTSTRFQRGEAVRVVEGPLNGLKGIFDLNLPGSQRVRVLLKMLGEHYTRVELPVGIIEPIKQP